eukprot:6192963-Pleurochrysis_carterae.AAC.1
MRKSSAKKHTELLPAPPPRHLAVAAAVAGHSDAYCCFNGPHSSRTSRSKAGNVATKFNAQGGTSKSAKSDTNMQKLAEHVTIDDADMQDDNASAEAERARHQERKEYFATLQEAAKRFDGVRARGYNHAKENVASHTAEDYHFCHWHRSVCMQPLERADNASYGCEYSELRQPTCKSLVVALTPLLLPFHRTATTSL